MLLFSVTCTHVTFQSSASKGKKSVVGPSRLPEGMGMSIVPDQFQQIFDFAISPEGTALGEDDVACDIAIKT